ncbi:IS200/IS605 family transposase [Echinicola sp. CAU 1574]|uniref:IS200/IS605 family transposase n=1 Tax=Echinicola arenosa TaxID=2774144 RepID=A0ABR9AMZ9_9BACT|nr:IS200/IS605 family transposase [Echinicola arenosa]MBD8490161.1 IS200/IS605 family transposase [Echinicola arenosa]MBD8490162.1 IS200/IS605 family transposase [Echinicola arenosa]
MANTYHQMYVQVVFAVKYRKAILDKAWRKRLFAVMGNLINETGCKCIIVNGVEDHVHCFFSQKPAISISEVMKTVKAKSSKWINENGLADRKFEWQKGFGCFTYSKSHVSNVYRYIENQEAHHHKMSFHEEYIELLKEYDVQFDLEYLFDPLF